MFSNVVTQTKCFCAYNVLFILDFLMTLLSLSLTFSVFKNITISYSFLNKSDWLTASSICNIQNLLFFMVQFPQLLKFLKVIFSVADLSLCEGLAGIKP